MESSVNEALEYLENRFGIERGHLDGFRLEAHSGDIWIVSAELDDELEVETNGLRLIRVMDIGLKPTTYGLQLLGDRIEKNFVDLDRKELVTILEREEMIPRELEEKGYVALKFSGRVIGCGFYKDEKVSSRVPKGRGKELLDILEK